MSVFVDSSAVYAGIDATDPAHREAVEIWSSLLTSGEPLVTHSLVEVEAAALIQCRLGIEAVVALRETLLPYLQVVEIDRDQRRSAMADVIVDGRRLLSIVDRVSFALMQRVGITRAFAFDRHFAKAGFDLIGSEG